MKHDILRRLCALLLCFVLALSLAVPSLADEGEGGGTGGGVTEGGDEGDGDGDGDGDGEDPNPNPTSITLSESSLELGRTNTTNTKTLTVSPAGLNVTWRSDDEKIATVSAAGVVTAVGMGETRITATLPDGSSASCRVTVTPLYVTRLNLAFDELLFRYSEKEKTPRADPEPSDADYDTIDFKSEDESIVTVEEPEEGNDPRRSVKIVAVGPGETYITAALVGLDGQKTINTERKRVTVSGIVISYTKDGGTGIRLSDSNDNDKGCDSLELTMGTSRNVTVDTYGDAKNVTKVDWYSSNNTVVSVASGRLTPRSVGSARITATRGNYSASFTVTVKENKTGLIEVDDSIPAGTPMSFSDISSDISKKFSSDTEKLYEKSKTLSYVTSLNVSPTQGILYYGYISEADTGSGVSMTNRFYLSSSSPSDYMLNGVTFVPNSTFSGNAEISYTGVSSDGITLSGIIRIPVDAMEDVTYTTGSGQNVFFRGSDFGTVCRLRTGRELASVTFTLPASSRGTLYYNYTADNQYSEKVQAATSYRRTGNPNLDSVSFMPADGFSGSVRISYRGTDTAGGTFSGYVTVTVTETTRQGDVVFSAKAGKEVSFTTAKFRTACSDVTGETLEWVRFTLPDSSEGTLYYTSGSTERKVTEKTAYYRSGSTSYLIGNVYFVPANNAPDQIRIAYTGRSTGGTEYTGTILIDYSGTAKSEAISYSVYSGRAVQFDASDFNTASIEATGSTLNYVYFELPSASRGLLCYNYTASSSLRNVSSTTRYYRSTSSSNRIDRVWFLADPQFTGTVEIPYTGYANNGEDFTGTVSIRVNSLTPAEVRFSGGASQPIALSASQIRYACNAVMDDELSYIEFTSLPSSTQGRLYRGYTGYDSGTQVVTGTPYYVSASPGIDQLSFVPRGGFSGVAYAGYTGVSTSGERVSGQISFTVAGAGTSAYFNDMGGYSWAVSAADFLYQNGVINGVGSGRYAPGDKIRRCDFVVMLCRAYNFSGGSGMTFADVPSNSYYASAVSTASSLGIVNGDGSNFRPNDQLTRQDAMVIIKRALEAAGWSLGGNWGTELNSFGDAGSVSDYARDAVATLVRLGAVNGDGNGNLRPRDPINRAEAAVILHYVMTM